MKFIFWHHEILGPLSLETLWDGSHGFAGSVGRLRIVFWLAARGHEVFLAGNVKDGELRRVRAVSGMSWLRDGVTEDKGGESPILVVLNPPGETDWEHVYRQRHRFVVVLWPVNPIRPIWLRRAWGGCPAKIVFISECHRDMYRIYPGFQAAEMCYLGVDLDLIVQAGESRVEPNTVFFCSVPRRAKGLHNLLRAWKRVRELVPDAELRISGSARMHDPRAEVGRTGILDLELEKEFPEFFSDLPASAARAGITFLGVLSSVQMIERMRASSVAVVNCNWHGSTETYCRSAVEAQAAGTPVVGAARGSLREVVRDGGTGLLIGQAKPDSLAEALVRLLRDSSLRKRMGEAGPAWAARFADYESLARDWEGIAARAVKREGAPVRRRWPQDLLRGVGYGTVRAWAREWIHGTNLERRLLKWMAGN